MRIVEPEVVAQRVEQRHVRIGVDRLRLAVHVEIYSSHGCMSPLRMRVGCGRIARTRLRAPAVHFAAIANCSSVAKLVQAAAQGNTPGAGFLAAQASFISARSSLHPSALSSLLALCSFSFTSAPNEGWWSADRRTLSFGRACEAHAREPPCPGATGPLSALHRGGFRLRTHEAGSRQWDRSPQRLPAPSVNAWRSGSGPPCGAVRAASAGRHSWLRLSGSFLENAPSEPGCKII